MYQQKSPPSHDGILGGVEVSPKIDLAGRKSRRVEVEGGESYC